MMLHCWGYRQRWKIDQRSALARGVKGISTGGWSGWEALSKTKPVQRGRPSHEQLHVLLDSANFSPVIFFQPLVVPS